MPCCMETELLPTWSASGKEAENIREFSVTGTAGAWRPSTTDTLLSTVKHLASLDAEQGWGYWIKL